MWLGKKKRNDRRKSRREGSPFVRSKVTSKPRSPGFTETRGTFYDREHRERAVYDYNHVFFLARRKETTAYKANDRNNAKLRNNMDARKFLAVAIHHDVCIYFLPIFPFRKMEISCENLQLSSACRRREKHNARHSK